MTIAINIALQILSIALLAILLFKKPSVGVIEVEPKTPNPPEPLPEEPPIEEIECRGVSCSPMEQAQRLSDKGEEFLVQWEGRRNKGYKDVAGFGTIGIGHLIRKGEPYKVDGWISDEEVDDLFDKDSIEVLRKMTKYITIQLNQNQFDALFSFVFNIRESDFAKSTLLRRLNEGNFEAAAMEFLRWKYASDPITGEKVIVQGLLNRRIAEKKLFEMPIDKMI